jgi:hypothetical protein
VLEQLYQGVAVSDDFDDDTYVSHDKLAEAYRPIK